MIRFRQDPDFIRSINIDQYKIIIGMDSQTSLLVILIENKKVFCIEGNERNVMKEKFYVKKLR
jgi:hypothetical protein